MNAIVRKAEAWVVQWVQLRRFLHGDFSLWRGHQLANGHQNGLRVAILRHGEPCEGTTHHPRSRTEGLVPRISLYARDMSAKGPQLVVFQ
jgi:hypothetical protein